ncbi:MAG: hypothetical protein RSD63_11100, partial [Eubacterium sp.]
SALKNDEIHELPHNLDDDCIDDVVIDENLIVTTDEELQAFYIIKSILRQIIPADRITYKDTRSYFSVIIDKKVTKWICRIYFKETVKFIVINIDGSDERFTIDTIDDIYIFSDELISKTNSNSLHLRKIVFKTHKILYNAINFILGVLKNKKRPLPCKVESDSILKTKAKLV